MYKVIAFDIYSASLDINGSAIPIVDEVIDDLSSDECAEFFKTWRLQQWNYLLLNNSMKDGYYSYRYITERVLEYTEKKFDISLTKAQKKRLMEIWTSFKAWPEAKRVIEELKRRGYKVAMLSNGDEDMLLPLQESTGIEFDYVFSGDQARCYKPSPGIYNNALKRLGLKADELLHVAGSVFDVMGAKSAGLHCAWSNRYKEYILDTRYIPDYEVSSLANLLTLLPGPGGESTDKVIVV
jgi:2-haloacid dehalogenase